MHGNLFEWSHDWFAEYDVDAVTDPLGAKEGSNRVSRGGSWIYVATYCRSGVRSASAPTSRSGSYGFRLALSLSGVAP
jgi:formylglycine-generating enzyme required for sulfatase activity